MKRSMCYHSTVYGLVALAFLIGTPLTGPEASAADVIIICNKDVSESSLSKSDLKNIFLGKKRAWDNGYKVTFVTLKTGDAHKYFCRNYLNKSTAQFMSHWKKMMFTGKGQMPKAFEKEQEVINFVAKTDGAISYVSANITSAQIKVLAVK